jgi:alcohol dehydrogenase class IV
MEEFRYTFYAEEVIFGPGAISRLSEALGSYSRQALLVTTANSRARGQVAAIEGSLGDRLAAVYDRVEPHVPEERVLEAVELGQRHDVDAVIGLGGGSAIGTAKAVSLTLEERRTVKAARAAYPTDQPLVPVVAVPTTYAGSEMTPIVGVTYRQSDGASSKVTLIDAKVAPKLVIYDPLLTLDLPPRLTGGTGINAIAHCIEALYSIRRNPLSSAAACSGLSALAHALPLCYADGGDTQARSEMLKGAFLAGTALANVAMGLHHGICHVLGGSANVAHGDANSVMLPHVIRFNLETVAPQLAEAAVALGLASDVPDRILGGNAGRDAEAVALWADNLIAELGLPRRLRDVGVRETDLHDLALQGMTNRTIAQNPRPVADAAELESLLRQAW